MRRLTIVIGLAVLLTQFGYSEWVFADNHGKVRMYKMNNKGQLFKQRWVKKAEIEGCKSSSRKREVQRFAQTGYNFCTLYSEENCTPGSEVTAMWGGDSYRIAEIDISQPQVKLLRGTKWNLDEDENVIIRSWYCEY